MPSLFDEPLYLQKFGLKEPPYSTKANERFLYLTPPHEEAIDIAVKVIRDKEGVALISGAFGTGKTTIMRRLYIEMRDDPEHFKVALIESGRRCPTEFQLAEEILESFGEKSKHNYRKGRYDQVQELLLNHYKAGLTSVLLIDDASQMPAKVLECLRAYLDSDDGEKNVLQIILFAGEGIRRKLPYAKSLRSRLWKTELRALTRAELSEMLRWRFRQAGGTVFPFTEEALERIYTLSVGFPNSACALAQLALEDKELGNSSITPEVIDRNKTKRYLEGEQEKGVL